MSRKNPKPGIESLAAAVIKDMEKGGCRKFCDACADGRMDIWKLLTEYRPHDYEISCFCHHEGGECCQKFKWACDRAYYTAVATGLDWKDILASWESHRDYWYMNYYQPANQPEIGGGNVFVFDDASAFKAAIGNAGFICPNCGHVGSNPYECTGSDCDWKSYGLFGCMGKGAHIFLKDAMRGETIFMPVALAGDAE